MYFMPKRLTPNDPEIPLTEGSRALTDRPRSYDRRMDASVDGEESEGLVGEAGLRRWQDAGRLIAQLRPHVFAQMVAMAEVTAVELSTVERRNID